MKQIINIIASQSGEDIILTQKIRQGDYDAWEFNIYLSDLSSAITGDVRLRFEKKSVLIELTAPVTTAGNKITYTLGTAETAIAGQITCWVQFSSTNLYTPIKILYTVEAVAQGTPIPSTPEYPEYLAAIEAAEDITQTVQDTYEQAEIDRGIAYGLAETARDGDYALAEGARDSSYAGAEQARDSLYADAEAERSVWIEWTGNEAREYKVGNKVHYLGSSYICHTLSTGHLPTDTDYWSIIVAKGDTGDAGTITVGSTNTAMTGLVAGNGTKISVPTAAQVDALPIGDAGAYFTTDQVGPAMQQMAAGLAQKASKGRVIVVAPTQGDYATIMDAVNAADDSAQNPVTILICPGEYEGHVHVDYDRYISLVGVNKDTCLITEKTGSYQFNPLRYEAHGRVENLTIISSTDETALDPDTIYAYALHIDAVSGVGNAIEIFNCRLVSNTSSALGMGLKENQTVKITQCELISTCSAASASNINGALYVHSAIAENTIGQHLIIQDSVLTASNGNTLYVADLGTGTVGMDVTFINDNLYNTANGEVDIIQVDALTTGNFSKQINLSERSRGNNIAYLNHKSNTPISSVTVGATWKTGTWTADNTTDTITCSANHGFSAGDGVSFGAGTGALPGGISAEPVFYYIESVPTPTTLKIKLTGAGAAVDITSDGTTGWQIRSAHSVATSATFDFNAHFEYTIYAVLSYVPNPANGQNRMTLIFPAGCLAFLNLAGAYGVSRIVDLVPATTKKYIKLPCKIVIRKISAMYYFVSIDLCGLQSDNADFTTSTAHTLLLSGIITGAEVTSLGFGDIYYTKVLNGSRFDMFGS